LLGEAEEWIGRCKPSILGEEGEALAAESGSKTLADILATAHRVEGKVINPKDQKGASTWAEGVGEGRTDEDNLCAYFRFSEGDDEDRAWIVDGVIDLTNFGNVLQVVGSDIINLEPTTSSVDEGEEGKVSLLHDATYSESCDRDRCAGLLLNTPRGSSIDVGILHSNANHNRKRCTLEFWVHLPPAHLFEDDVILARRTLFGKNADSSHLARALTCDGLIWELVLLRSGRLQFRSGSGSILTTGTTYDRSDENDHNDDASGSSIPSEDSGDKDPGFLTFQRSGGAGGGWNHICLIMSSREQEDLDASRVRILLRGQLVASRTMSVTPNLQGGKIDHANLDTLMDKTVILFGLGAPAGFRLTELRIWCCERNEEDVKALMYEYLSQAEQKKRIKIRIRGKNEGNKRVDKLKATNFELKKKTTVLFPERRSRAISTGLRSQMTMPKTSTDIKANKSVKDNTTFAPPGDFEAFKDAQFSFQDTLTQSSNEPLEKNEPMPDSWGMNKESVSFDFDSKDAKSDVKRFQGANRLSDQANPFASHYGAVEKSSSRLANNNEENKKHITKIKTDFGDMSEMQSSSDTVFQNNIPEKGDHDFSSNATDKQSAFAKLTLPDSKVTTESESTKDDAESNDQSIASLYLEEKVQLSQQVRSSVAAALVRGPPAARHFGGNRGGVFSRSIT